MQTLNNTDTLTPAEKIRWIARAKEQLFALLRAEISGEQLPEEIKAALTPECIKGVYALAKAHDLAHLAGDALAKNKLIPDAPALRMQLTKAVYTAVYRFEQSQRETARLSAAMEESRIPFVLLKGAVIRDYYPEPWMRTSCDIDVLVREEDLERATDILTSKLGYRNEGRGYHDVSLFSQSGVHIELHYTLLDELYFPKAQKIAAEVWSCVSPVRENRMQMRMSDELFYFYHILHMANHFFTGGCGIRPFIDLQIMDCREQYSAEKTEALLKTGGLLKFARAAQSLAGVWFGEQEYTELSQKMEAFILFGGVYGTVENMTVVQQVKKGGRLPSILSKIFLPYGMLKGLYPVLQRHKWLMPFCQVARWFRLLSGERWKRSVNELKTNMAGSHNNNTYVADLLKELDL